MAKRKSSKKKTSKKQPATQNIGLKIFAIIFIVAMLIGFTYPLINQGSKRSQQRQISQGTNTASNAPLPPAFKKEGELFFIKVASNDSLNIDIEIAETEEETSQGLMYRTKLGDKQGMLFIFKEAEMKSFWMKNTYIPLDILFVDSELNIITLHADTQPFSQESVSSSAEAQYVVEVNAGFCAKYGVKEGDKISFKKWTKS